MTISRLNRRLLFALLFILFSGKLAGQIKDYRTWFEAEFDKGLNNGIVLSLEVEQRLKNNSLRYDRTQLTIAGEYDFNKHLRTAAGIRGILSRGNEELMHGSYRLHADATGRYTLAEIDLSWRLRLQYGFEDISFFDLVNKNNLACRNRLRGGYHIFGTRITLFTLVESWHLLSGKPARYFRKLRYSAGVQYDLNFRSEISLRYIMENEFNVTNPLQTHILVFGYAYSL
jgi:hypothetical protein